MYKNIISVLLLISTISIMGMEKDELSLDDLQPQLKKKKIGNTIAQQREDISVQQPQLKKNKVEDKPLEKMVVFGEEKKDYWNMLSHELKMIILDMAGMNMPHCYSYWSKPSKVLSHKKLARSEYHDKQYAMIRELQGISPLCEVVVLFDSGIKKTLIVADLVTALAYNPHIKDELAISFKYDSQNNKVKIELWDTHTGLKKRDILVDTKGEDITDFSFDPHEPYHIACVIKGQILTVDLTQKEPYVKNKWGNPINIENVAYDVRRKDKIYWKGWIRVGVLDIKTGKIDVILEQKDLAPDDEKKFIGSGSLIAFEDRLDVRINNEKFSLWLCDPFDNVRKFTFIRNGASYTKPAEPLKAAMLWKALKKIKNGRVLMVSPEEYAYFLVLDEGIQKHYQNNIRIRKRTEAEKINNLLEQKFAPLLQALQKSYQLQN